MSRRWELLVERLGGEEQARQYMRDLSAKSARNRTGRGTFAELKEKNPEKLKELQRRGGHNKQLNRKRMDDSV